MLFQASSKISAVFFLENLFIIYSAGGSFIAAWFTNLLHGELKIHIPQLALLYKNIPVSHQDNHMDTWHLIAWLHSTLLICQKIKN